MKWSEGSLTDEVFYTQDLQKEHKKALKQSFVAKNRDEIFFCCGSFRAGEEKQVLFITASCIADNHINPTDAVSDTPTVIARTRCDFMLLQIPDFNWKRYYI